MPKIFISVGEESGDQRAAVVVDEISKLLPGSRFKAMGGNALKSKGADLIIDSNKYGGLMGFKEVVASLGKTKHALETLKREIDEWSPDLLLLVDYPDFNLRLAKHAYQKKIPVLYYIPPKVWAWRKGRVKLLKKYCASIATIFPFETEFYLKNGCTQQQYVGHPFVDEIGINQIDRHSPQYSEARAKFLSSLSLDPSVKTIAVFPGSRKHEIEKHLAVLLQAYSRLKDTYGKLQCIITAPSDNFRQSNLAGLVDSSDIKVVSKNSLEVLKYSDIGILKSGTCNLEAAFVGLPFTMIFQASAITAFIVRNLLKIKEVSPVNLIKSGSVVELLQEKFTGDAVYSETLKLLTEEKALQDIKASLNDVVSSFLTPGIDRQVSASMRVAKMAAGIIENRQ